MLGRAWRGLDVCENSVLILGGADGEEGIKMSTSTPVASSQMHLQLARGVMLPAHGSTAPGCLSLLRGAVLALVVPRCEDSSGWQESKNHDPPKNTAELAKRRSEVIGGGGVVEFVCQFCVPGEEQRVSLGVQAPEGNPPASQGHCLSRGLAMPGRRRKTNLKKYPAKRANNLSSLFGARVQGVQSRPRRLRVVEAAPRSAAVGKCSELNRRV